MDEFARPRVGRPTDRIDERAGTGDEDRINGMMEDVEDVDVDEFGRKRDPQQKVGRMDDETSLPQRRRWPPPFDKRSVTYVFDARSGMFYHASSQFFYDPKSKLYFSNKDQLYYRYVPDHRKDCPPFQPIEQQPYASAVSVVASEVSTDSLALEQLHQAKQPEKKVISISLKTKALRGEATVAMKNDATLSNKKKRRKQDESGPNQPKDVPTTVAAVAGVIPSKEHAAFMDRWSERGKELRGDRNTEPAPVLDALATSCPAVIRTKTGLPVCSVCRRKFPSVSKLHRHERHSSMHKDKIAMAKKQQQRQMAAKETAVSTIDDDQASMIMLMADDAPITATTSAVASYRDRAWERRILHGPSAADLLLPTPPSVVVGQQQLSVCSAPSTTKVEVPLGENTIGNQMLQKWGWKAGSVALDEKKPVNPLKSDWERIEAMAAAKPRGG